MPKRRNCPRGAGLRHCTRTVTVNSPLFLLAEYLPSTLKVRNSATETAREKRTFWQPQQARIIVSRWKRLWLTLLFLGWSLCALPALAQKPACSCARFSCPMSATSTSTQSQPFRSEAPAPRCSETEDEFCGVSPLGPSVSPGARAASPSRGQPCECSLEDKPGKPPVKLEEAICEPVTDLQELVISLPPLFRLLLATECAKLQQVCALPAGWLLPASPPVAANLTNLPPPLHRVS